MKTEIKSVRFQVVLPVSLKKEVASAAEKLGIPLSGYIKDAIKEKLRAESGY